MTIGKHEQPSRYWVSISKKYLSAAGLDYLLDNLELEELGTDDCIVVSADSIETSLGTFVKVRLYPAFLNGKWADVWVPMQYILSFTEFEDPEAMAARKLGFAVARRGAAAAGLD